ncbi:MAG: flagellin FliC, partial [Myxococcales bacterium]|nr:flagellin FliC [Myxococcales bacterium]
MALTVTNTASANAQRHLSRNTSDLQRVIERLASGSRINSA